VEVLKMDDGGMGLEKRILVGMLEGRRGMGVGMRIKEGCWKRGWKVGVGMVDGGAM
jgi:hypothetical protein